MPSKIGDIGIVYKVRLVDNAGQAIDLTSSTSLAIEFERPDGLRFEKTAVVTTGTGTDGNMQYENVSAEGSILDMVGTWKFRGRAVFTDGDRLTGDWVEETVIS